MLVLKTQGRGARRILHADHLVQPAALGLREAGHHRGEPTGAYEGFATETGSPGTRALAIWVARRRNASSTFWPFFAVVRTQVQPDVSAISACSAPPDCACSDSSAMLATRP